MNHFKKLFIIGFLSTILSKSKSLSGARRRSTVASVAYSKSVTFAFADGFCLLLFKAIRADCIHLFEARTYLVLLSFILSHSTFWWRESVPRHYRQTSAIGRLLFNRDMQIDCINFPFQWERNECVRFVWKIRRKLNNSVSDYSVATIANGWRRQRQQETLGNAWNIWIVFQNGSQRKNQKKLSFIQLLIRFSIQLVSALSCWKRHEINRQVKVDDVVEASCRIVVKYDTRWMMMRNHCKNVCMHFSDAASQAYEVWCRLLTNLVCNMFVAIKINKPSVVHVRGK